jgi:hypothetical protein
MNSRVYPESVYKNAMKIHFPKYRRETRSSKIRAILSALEPVKREKNAFAYYKSKHNNDGFKSMPNYFKRHRRKQSIRKILNGE